MNLPGRKIFRYKIIIAIFLILFIISPTHFALELYADVTIDITESGFITIEGNSNYPGLLEFNTQNYTTKIQDDWFFNITKDEIFSELIFKVFLPPSSSIYSVNSSGTVWIGKESDRLVVYGLGENESFSLSINYQLSASLDKQDPQFFNFTNIVLLILIVIIILLIFINLYKTQKKKQVPDKGSFENIKGLTERQNKIMKLLYESSNPLTQTDIEKELNMPKAAVSRNIHSLEYKGLIEIEKVGMSNFIRVKKQ